MPRARDYRLNEQALAVIETAIKHDPRPQIRLRCMAIRLLHLGHKPQQVAEILAVSTPAIYYWIQRYQQRGVEGLATKDRSGRPPKADATYVQAVEAALQQEPSAWGYDFAIWTIERLGAHLEQQTGITLSDSRLRILIRRLGYRYRRPKYSLEHVQDKDAKAQAAALLEALKKRPLRRQSSSSLWTKQP